MRDRPDVWEKALADFAATPNSTGLLWKVEKDGVPPSWLFGTMHVTDAALGPSAKKAFAESNTVVLESTEVLDPANRVKIGTELAGMTKLAEGTVFDTEFTSEEKEALGKLTAAHGVPYFAARRLKPWFLGTLLAVPPCVQAAMLQGNHPLDEQLYLDAVAGGKKVVGLESAAEQMAALRSLDTTTTPQMLLEYVRLGPEEIENWYATLAALYAEERPTLLVALMAHMPELQAQATVLAESDDALVTGRNLVMRDRLLPILEEGGAFVAVGALHLSGAKGLVELLRESGYTVTRAP
jgi:uncharacterized protein YbaP (TraB family)